MHAMHAAASSSSCSIFVSRSQQPGDNPAGVAARCRQGRTRRRAQSGLRLTTAGAQLLKYSENLTKGRAGQILNMDNFIDTSNIEGRFEFSEWVRAYGKYLDEQLDVYSRISFYQARCRAHLWGRVCWSAWGAAGPGHAWPRRSRLPPECSRSWQQGLRMQPCPALPQAACDAAARGAGWGVPRIPKPQPARPTGGGLQEQEVNGGTSKLRTLGSKELLVQLPMLQHLLQRLVDCKPTGRAMHDPVVQVHRKRPVCLQAWPLPLQLPEWAKHPAAKQQRCTAGCAPSLQGHRAPPPRAPPDALTAPQASLLLVLTESFKVYKAISEGLINLADRFFEMEYLDALQGLEAYKESLVANERLQVGLHLNGPAAQARLTGQLAHGARPGTVWALCEARAAGLLLLAGRGPAAASCSTRHARCPTAPARLPGAACCWLARCCCDHRCPRAQAPCQRQAQCGPDPRVVTRRTTTTRWGALRRCAPRSSSPSWSRPRPTSCTRWRSTAGRPRGPSTRGAPPRGSPPRPASQPCRARAPRR